MKKQLFLFFCVPLFTVYTYGQLTVNGGLTAQQLAENLAGSNVVITNATLTGSTLASGTFNGATSNLGFNSGIILSTGNINTAPGPNNAAGSSNNLSQPGTAQMTALAGNTSVDAITLEFDFQVQSPFVQFNYIFASEEYPEYAPPNSATYNDVFAFFISGPGISGEENIALIPNTSNPVAINNINAVTNSQYYINNAGGATVQFDGFTTSLVAKREGLISCQTYHLKLVIADVGDPSFNSAVFLQENSFVQGLVDVQTQTLNADNVALEGCVKGSFTFSFNEISNQDRIINYTVEGTAVNGVDYDNIDNSLTIPAGDLSATVFIDAFADGLLEGQESIDIIFQPAPCAPNDTTHLFINDAQSIDFELDGTNLDCFEDNSGEILVTATGGFPPYEYTYTPTGGSSVQTTTNPITGLAAGEYTVQVTDAYGCIAEALVVGGQFNAGTTYLPDGSGVTYTAPLAIAGFNAGELITNVNQIQQVCLTMEHSYLGDLVIQLQSPNGQIVTLKDGGGGGGCHLGEPVDIDAQVPGVGYEYCFNSSPVFGTMVAESGSYTHTYTDAQGSVNTSNYLPAGSYTPYDNFDALIGSPYNGTWTIRVTDQYSIDNGYIFNWYISLMGDMPDSTIVLNQPAAIAVTGVVTNSPCGAAAGSINASVSGGSGNYQYLWSNGATTEDVSGLTSGVYTATVTDNVSGCSINQDFIVNNISSLNIAETVTNVACAGGSNGSIELVTTGGTSPYSWSWSNGATTEDISALTAGSFTVSLSDANGCLMTKSIAVQQSTSVQITLTSLINEKCNTDNGSIALQVSGGSSGSYGYYWNTGATTRDISNLTSGTYTITATDGFGCTASQSYSIINDISDCSAFCFMEIHEDALTDELCGNGNGAIDVSLLNALSPVVISWSNGSATEDLTALTAGSYTVSVSDANNCQAQRTFVVSNNTGNLAVTDVAVTSDFCGNSSGAVSLDVNGGALPYIYTWSNGATTQDLSGVPAGDFTLQVRDANNCVASQSFTVGNNSGTMTVQGTTQASSCTSSSGTIQQIVSGASANLSYVWNDGPTTKDRSNLAAGTYTCTITDLSSNCSLVKTYTIIQNNASISLAGVNVTNELCNNNGGSINITTSGNGLTYLWSNGATTEDLTGISAGNYSVTITNSFGCTYNSSSFVVLNSSGTLNVTEQLVIDETCSNSNGSVNINVAGGTTPYSYSWSNGSTAEDLSGLTAGTYSVIVTDNSGCQRPRSFTVLNSSGTLAIQNAITANETCGNGAGAINLQVSGGTLPLSYSWSNSAVTQDISGLSAATYNVTVTDANGCQQQGSYVVGNNANSLQAVSQVTNEICDNNAGSIQLNVTGGTAPYTFLWSTAASTSTISSLDQGTYSCQVTDNSGCIITTGTIAVNNSSNGMFATTSVSPAICSSPGSVNLTISGGATPVGISWSNGSSTEDLASVAAGDYTYTLTDNNGCTTSGTATVPLTDGTLDVMFQTAPEVCNNNLGSIDLVISGGTTPYNIGWNTGAVSEDLSGLDQGSYSAVVTDAAGCNWSSGPITITNSAGTLQITDLAVTNATCASGAGAINLTISGGTLPITYAWSNGAATQDINGLSPNTYTVQVTDNNGCVSTAQGVVSSSSGSFNIQPPVIINENCGLGNGSINITPISGTAPITYVWSNGASTQDISGLSAGTYYLTATDANGCQVNRTYSVTSGTSSLSIANSSITNESCGNGNGAVNVTVTGGSSPYTFTWSNGATTEDLTGLSAGTYSLTLTDNTGCSVSQTYTLSNLTSCVNIMCTHTSSTQQTGTLADPGGIAGNYGNNQTCEFLIAPACADAVTLQFSSFATQSASDYVRVYDGSNALAPLLLSASGSSIPADVTGNSGKLFIRFTSNASTVSTGFIADWTTTPYTAPPTVSFSSTNSNPALGTSVSFTATTSGSDDLLAWDVDSDGFTDYTAATISHAYTTPGTYTVTLIATNCFGSSTYSSTITVQGAPIVDVTPTTVTDYTITDCDETITHTFTISNTGTGDLVWNVPVSNGVSPSVSNGVLAPGASITVSLQFIAQNSAGTVNYHFPVNSNDPVSSSVVNDVNLHQAFNCRYLMCVNPTASVASGKLYDSGGPTANYSNSENCSFLIQPTCASAITLNFTGFSTQLNQDVLRIYDGIDATGALLLTHSGTTIPAAVTANSGSMFVQFNSSLSTNSTGFSASWTSTVVTGIPVAAFTASDLNPAFNSPVAFTSTATDAMSYSWDVDGDGVTDYTSVNPTHTYTAPGTYIVRQIVTNCYGSDTTFVTIVVQDAPSASVTPTTSPDVSLTDCNPGTATLTIHNTGGGNLEWTLPEANITSGTIPAGGQTTVTITVNPHDEAGTYMETATLTTNDPANPSFSIDITVNQTTDCIERMCVDSFSDEATGRISDSGGSSGPYTANEYCGYLIQPACAGEITLTVESLNTQWGDYLIVYDGIDNSGFMITYMDGTTISPPATATSGSMYVEFYTTSGLSGDGFVANWTTTAATAAPDALFYVSNTFPMAGEQVDFYNYSTGSVDGYAWDVNGDGVTDYTTLNCSHIYTVPGTYNAQLTVTNCVGSTTYTEVIVVQEAGEIDLQMGSLTVTTNDCDGADYTFQISNVGGTQLDWYVYSDLGISVNPTFGTLFASETATVSVYVPPYATPGTYSIPIYIQSTDPDESMVTYTLTVISTADCSASVENRVCVTAGSTAPSGTLYDSGGSSGSYSPNEYCGFLIQPGCAQTVTVNVENFNLQFGDYLIFYDGPDDTYPMITYFEGGTTPTAVSSTTGSMYVQSYGTSGTTGAGFKANWTSTSSVPAPVAGFTSSETSIEPGETVVFTNTSTGAGNTYAWDVNGDGVTDFTSTNASFTYTTPGTYTVELTASNCAGTSSITQVITVTAVPTSPQIAVVSPNGNQYTATGCGTTTHLLTVSNTGTANLDWSVAPNTQYILSPASGTILPGGSQTVTMTIYAFGDAGTYPLPFAVTSNDPLAPSVAQSVTVEQNQRCYYSTCTDNGSMETTGRLTDSGGPHSNYGSDEDCGFLIQPSCAGVITLDVDAINLSASDFISIYDGTSASAPLLLTASGSTVPAPVIATSGAMYIVFSSDATTSDSGFDATWTSAPASISGSSTPAGCDNASGTVAQTMVNGAGFSYLWNTGETTEDLSGLAAGTYTCTASSASGCVFTNTYQVTGNQAIAITSVVVDDGCGKSNGSIDLSITGGTGNYALSWSNGAGTEDLSSLSEGTYTCQVTDLSTGCSEEISVIIANEITIFDISGTVTHASCGFCSNGGVQLNDPSAGNIYMWSNGTTTADITGLLPGAYSLTVFAPNGCDTTLSFTIGNLLGLEDLSGELTVSVYPNPAAGLFFVQCTIPANELATVYVTDMLGKLVYTGIVKGDEPLQIDSTPFNYGVYTVTVAYGSGIFNERIVIDNN